MDNRKLAKFATVWCNPGVLDRMAKSDENSAQLIECVNPEHLYLGSIHYIQPDCVGKWEQANSLYSNLVNNVPSNSCRECGVPVGSCNHSRADSDESWQASEALLNGQT